MNLGDLLTDTIGLVAAKKTIDKIVEGDILDDAIGLVSKPAGKV